MLGGTPEDVTVVVSPTTMEDEDTLSEPDELLDDVGVRVAVAVLVGVGVRVAVAVAVGVGVRVAVAVAVGVGARVGLQRKELGFFSQYVGVGVGVGVGVLVGNLTQYQYGSCASMQSSKVVQGLRGFSHCPLTPPSSSSAAPDGPPPSGGDCAITALTAIATPANATPHTSTMRCMSFLRNEISLLENEKRSHVHDVVVVSRPRAEVKVDISRCFVGVMLGDRNSAGAAVRRHRR